VIQSVTFEPRGPFSLRAAAGFAFGPSAGSAPPFDGALRLAFAIDGGEGYAGVVVRQPGEDSRLECEVQADGGDLTLIERQVASPNPAGGGSIRPTMTGFPGSCRLSLVGAQLDDVGAAANSLPIGALNERL
jgi:hypothetical protein